MKKYKEILSDELREMAEECEKEYEEFLKEVDRDSYYHSINLIDEFTELDEDISEEWKEDVESLAVPYRLFVIKHILNSKAEELPEQSE